MKDGLWGKHWRLMAALAGVLAAMAVGAGIALAVSQGTAGELSYRLKESTVDPSGFRTVKAPCPNTRHVTGGGYDAATPVKAYVSIPYDSSDGGTVPDDGWKVRFYNPDAGTALVDVYAVCDD
jgi:hypothetical protein